MEKLKYRLLELLKESSGNDVSGQWLAEKLSVSRAAVWKAANTLKSEGCMISASTNRGYRFISEGDMLCAELIYHELAERFSDVKVIVREETGSTNRDAKEFWESGFRGRAVIAADFQSSGRGRLGRSFFSPKGTGIYFTLVLNGISDFADAAMLTPAAAVAVCKSVKKLCGIDCRIKWVNDVFLNEKKLCGILTEAVTDMETKTVACVVVGIGINFKNGSFPPELRDIACSLFENGDPSITRNALIADISAELFDSAAALTAKQINFMDEYRERSFIIGSQIGFIKDGAHHTATAVGIDNAAGLIVNENGSVYTLRSGEVSIKPV